jgi:hypothetical protein
MADQVLDDPGELIRFWLWFQKHQAMRRLVLADLARHLKIKSPRVAAWLGRHAIPTNFWNPIARYFQATQTYRDIEDQARELWKEPKNRLGFTPLYQLQPGRRGPGRRTAA